MTEMQLWSGPPPGSEDWLHDEVTYPDEFGEPVLRNVAVPTITPYLPDSAVATGPGVIVAPGGGFEMLAINHEGRQVCEWLAARGVAAFLLKYRVAFTGATTDDFVRLQRERYLERIETKALDDLMRDGLTAEELAAWLPDTRRLAFDDGAQAMRLVRSRADEWNIDPDRLGFIGFSAGAFVTVEVALHEDESARPTFVAPIYGGHVDGDVPDDAPPMFCVVAADDPLCYDASVRTHGAWRAARRPAELHVYAQGGHGFGMRKTGLPVDSWIELMGAWMRSLGYMREVEGADRGAA